MMKCVNSFSYLYENTLYYSQKVYTAFYRSFNDTQYIFFSEIEPPYLTDTVNINSTSSAKPLWVYIPGTQTFIAWPLESPTESIKSSSLPILSMEIVDKNATKYDLTDFIIGINVKTFDQAIYYPSIAHIIGAWTIYSKVVLNPKCSVRLIDIDGDIKEVDIGSLDIIRPKMETVD